MGHSSSRRAGDYRTLGAAKNLRWHQTQTMPMSPARYACAGLQCKGGSTLRCPPRTYRIMGSQTGCAAPLKAAVAIANDDADCVRQRSAWRESREPFLISRRGRRQSSRLRLGAARRTGDWPLGLPRLPLRQAAVGHSPQATRGLVPSPFEPAPGTDAGAQCALRAI